MFESKKSLKLHLNFLAEKYNQLLEISEECSIENERLEYQKECLNRAIISWRNFSVRNGNIIGTLKEQLKSEHNMLVAREKEVADLMQDKEILSELICKHLTCNECPSYPCRDEKHIDCIEEILNEGRKKFEAEENKS
jgi:hypothetical protein